MDTMDAADDVQAATGPSKGPMAALLATLLVASLFVGAAMLKGEDLSSNEVLDGQPPTTSWRPYSVVAPIDTGINVYHDHFRTNETYPNWLLDGLGVTKTCVPTFEGTW